MEKRKYHHGYLLVGDTDSAKEAALQMASEILGRDKGLLFSHPDFSFVEKRLLSIDDARRVREDASKNSFFGKGRIFLIKSDSISREAGSALLKTLEEPVVLSYFFIIMPSLAGVLETLRSRLAVLKFEGEKRLSGAKLELAENFLKSDLVKRNELIKPIAREKEKILEFLSGLEIILRNKMLEEFPGQTADFLSELMKQKRFVFQRSPSLKMILEHLSLVLPKL